MIVYGGIDKNGEFLNDVWEFDIDRMLWFQCNILLHENIQDDLGIAFHSMCAVYSKINLFNCGG